MKSTTARRVALSIAVATALSGVAACGSSDTGKTGKTGKDDKAAGKSVIHVSPIAALRSAEQSTNKADSAKVRTTMSIGDVMTVTAKGAVNWSHGLKGNLTMSYTGGQMAEAMKKLGTSTMEARYLSDAAYVRMGDTTARQMGGKHWVKYAYDDLAKLGGASGSYMKDQLQNATPNQSVRMLLASHDLKKVGEETVTGVRTTHYSGTVNLADLAGKTSNLSADQLAALKQQLSQAGVTTDTVDIWINDQNLLIKKAEKADTPKGAMTNTTYYSDYGVKVTTQAPPANDTKDFTDLLKSGGAMSGGTGAGTGVSS
ncbi:hypothetical protein LK07_13545 [Streptomyces pluripotens]|uniref:Lipoprotein n=1 Tax=Streptomyces pluripotens TaxID=1355015 RepID=A0A221NY28_9ACTN|nr:MULTISPECIES: lipoprotein [Streptomyces]ARP70638.1 hypothetical protein LK06_012415 [Streptomyces pluripotens]ASN24899.1 hypothetical protein LK07_13545 [Streptomyces pluripotens]KIE23956.1 lipoprotein [Streptomyces sp. MUSC 125]MCH0556672.1 hypothetical protein [Streptomyces sp. MUM 16J]